MTISYVTSGHQEKSNASTGYTVTVPAGTLAGDMLLVQIQTDLAIAPVPPSGVTQLRSDRVGSAMFYKALGSADSGVTLTFNVGSGSNGSMQWVIYRGVASTPHASAATVDTTDGTETTTVCPAVTTTVPCKIVRFGGVRGQGAGNVVSTPAGHVSRLTLTSLGYPGVPFNLSDIDQSAAGDSGTGTVTFDHGNYQFGTTVALAPLNSAPNAPTLTGPANNATIDRTVTQRFTWAFSDPDTGDSQSAFDLRYSSDGGSTWTTVSGTTPNQYYDFASGAFAAGSYQWQVRCYDSQGVVGPWSASSFFTGANPPSAVTITAPTSGGTVSTTPATVSWSAPNQDDYQVRRVADNGGSADTSTVYYDSGDVVDSTTRSVSVAFETNNRYEHVQVRIKYNGLWSSWSDVRVQVSYTPPTTATLSVTADSATASILVQVTNPAPGAGVPAASSNDIYVREVGTTTATRVAAGVAPGTSWTWWTPASGVDYEFQVVTTATNGTSSSSAWTA